MGHVRLGGLSRYIVFRAMELEKIPKKVGPREVKKTEQRR